MPLTVKVLEITTSGGAGAASGSGSFATAPARLAGVLASGNIPATTDITLTASGRTFTLSTNVAGPLVSYPSEQARDAAGALVPAGDGGRWRAPILDGGVTVNVAQADNGSVLVKLILEHAA